MGKVITVENATFQAQQLVSQAAGEVQDCLDIALANAGGILFGTWNTGVAPSNRYFHELSNVECLGIGLCALGFGLHGVENEGRAGIWLKPYLDRTIAPILVEFILQKKGIFRSAMDGNALSQSKQRQTFLAKDPKTGEVNRLLLRVPHS